MKVRFYSAQNRLANCHVAKFLLLCVIYQPQCINMIKQLF